MRKWIPYLIGLFTFVIIFVSSVVMIKKRSFVFKDNFIKEGKAVLLSIEEDFHKKMKSDIFKNFPVIEQKLLSDNIDESKVKIVLKNMLQLESLVDNFFVTDKDLNLKYYDSKAKPSQKELDSLKWAVNNQPEKQEIKVFYQSKEKRFVAYKIFRDYKIFAFFKPEYLSSMFKQKYPFLKNDADHLGMIISSKNFFIGIDHEVFSKYQNLFSKALKILEKGKSFEMKIEGSYIFWKKLQLKASQKIAWDFNLFVMVDPYKYPLNIWHKLILIIIAAFVVLAFVFIVIQIKKESDKNQIMEFEQTDDFLNNHFRTISEADEDSFDDDYLDDEDEYYDENEIPDEYFDKYADETSTSGGRYQELSSLIGEVRNHEEDIQRYNSLWENVSNILGNSNEYKMMISFLDEEENEFIPHFKKNFDEATPLVIESDSWLISEYLLKTKALYIMQDGFSVTPIKEMFPVEYHSDINSLFLAPLQNEKGFRGIFILFSSREIKEDKIREINSLVNLG